MSLGSYATIPKAKRGTSLDRTTYRFLDAVHMDIAFGDCVSVEGYRYALILVDRATRYNWAFGLKTLSSECILSALCLFRAAASSLTCCFYCDCDPKLFGQAIRDYLVDNTSKVVAAPAKQQSSNGLVESHWKVMVHMARAYLTQKQMPRAFWFYAIIHAARMMNAIPGRIHGRLASPFLLVHGVGHDERRADVDSTFLTLLFPSRKGRRRQTFQTSSPYDGWNYYRSFSHVQCFVGVQPTQQTILRAR
jgi:hypothetical protein